MLNQIAAIHGTGVAAATNSYESIATATPSGVSSFSFTSIPSTYKHLQVRYISRNTSAALYVLLRFNSDTGANYATHTLEGTGTAATAGAYPSDTQMYMPRNATTSPFFAAGIIDILDYANTNKNKTVRGLGGYDQNGTGQRVDFNSGLWTNTAAINTLNFSVSSGSYATDSHFALYGIKG